MHSRWTVFGALLTLCFAAVSLALLPPAKPFWIAPPGTITHFRFAPNDRVFAVVLSQTDDPSECRLLVVNCATGQSLLDTTGPSATNLCFDRNARYVAVLWGDSLRIYDIATVVNVQTIDRQLDDEFLSTRRRPTALIYGPPTLAFTDDSLALIVGSDRWTHPCKEKAWNIITGEPQSRYGPASFWFERGLATDRSKMFSGGWPGPTPRVGDLWDGHRITYCFRYPYHLFATFTRDNAHLLTIHEDGAMFLWELRDTDNENAAILRSEMNTGLEHSLAFAILNRTDRLAHIDRNRRLRFRKLFHGGTTADGP